MSLRFASKLSTVLSTLCVASLGCRSRVMSSTDATLRGGPLTPSPSTGRPAHFVTADEVSASIASGPVPGFAGDFLQGCSYVVLLTDTPRQAAAARSYFSDLRRGWCGGKARPLVFGQVRYDFAQLYDWYVGPFRALTRIPGVTETYIDERRNQLAIGARDSAAAARLERTLDALPIPKGVVRIERARIACAGTGGPSVVVEVRDQQGNPAAIGTTIVIQDGAFTDSVDGAHAESDLRVGAGHRRPGTYEVRLYKPGYKPVVLHDVRAPGDTLCRYALPTDIRKVTLELLPDAPTVRSITVLPSAMGFFMSGPAAQLRAVLDADPGASKAVRWTSSDTSVATVTSSGEVTAKCRQSPGEAIISAVSVAEPRVRGHARVTVYAARPGASCAR